MKGRPGKDAPGHRVAGARDGGWLGAGPAPASRLLGSLVMYFVPFNVPGRRAARIGMMTLVLFWAVLLYVEIARAREVPPVIIGVREAMRDARRALEREAPAHAVGDAGGECRELVDLGEGDELLPTELEREVIARQVATCERRPGRRADVWGLLILLRLEAQLGVPDESRGILAAVWCVEGALLSRELRGDVRGGVARAHGPFQLWPWHREWCGLAEGGADDLEAAARCYWARVVDRREARALECDDSWRVGEALAANGPAYLSMGCAAESSHWRAMEAAR